MALVFSLVRLSSWSKMASHTPQGTPGALNLVSRVCTPSV